MPNFVIYDTTSMEVMARQSRAPTLLDPHVQRTPTQRVFAEMSAVAEDIAMMDAQIEPGQAWLLEDFDTMGERHCYVDDSDPSAMAIRVRPQTTAPTLDRPRHDYIVGEVVTVTGIKPGSEIFVDGVSQGTVDTGSFQFTNTGRGYHYLKICNFPDVDHELTVFHSRKREPKVGRP